MSTRIRASHTLDSITEGVRVDPVTFAIAYLAKAYRGRWRVAEVARSLRVSESHISRLFRRHTGWSMRQYVTHLRMGAAVDLLRTTTMTIKEVAASVGYSGTSAFDHEFGRTFGMSPRRWRAALRPGPSQSDRWSAIGSKD